MIGKPTGLMKVLFVVFGFGFLMHVSHRECARSADNPIQEKASTIAGAVYGTNGSAFEDYRATCYCLTGITRGGVQTAPGVVAADWKVIPLGSVIYVDSPFMGGIYQVLDAGKGVKGKIIDIFMPTYDLCKQFGLRKVKVKVLRYGFHGNASEKTSPNKSLFIAKASSL
jgi:3D (Asp-Asp-Asp) domain-containing protein